jgi:hypothetical protein
MKKTENLILTAVIPIGDYQSHFKNIDFIIQSCRGLPIKLVLVLDTQSESSYKSLEATLIPCTDLLWELRKTEAKSPGIARNEGLKCLETPWVTFWDSDDLPDPATIIRSISECHPGTEVLVGNFNSSDAYGIELRGHSFFESDRLANGSILAKNPGIWRIVFRSSVIGNVIFPDLRMAEDQNFLLNILSKVNRIQFSNKIFYTYKIQSEKSLTKTRSSMNDLPKALSLAITTVKKSESQFLPIQNTMLLKLFFSTLKHGNSRAKFYAIRIFVTHSIFNVLGAKSRKPKSRNPNFVLAGGLGNQLFQLAAALSTTRKSTDSATLSPNFAYSRLNYFNNPELDNLILPSNIEFNYFSKPTPFLRKALNLTLRFKLANKISIFGAFLSWISSILISLENLRFTRFITYNDLGYVGDLKGNPNSLHFGYFQTYRYAEKEMVLDRLLSLMLRNQSAELVELQEFASQENPLLVHVRLTDYLNEEKFGTPDCTYYENAINLQMETNLYGRIWVFSDDIEAAKKLIPDRWFSQVRWINQIGLDAATTWQAMRLGSGYVIANSSYSWWAAFLANKRDARVVAPNPWFAGMDDPMDLIPPGWIQLSARKFNQHDGNSE